MKRSIAYDTGVFEADCAAADVGGAAVVCNGNIVCLGFSIGNLISLGIQAKSANYNLNRKIAIVRFIFYFIHNF